MCNKSTRRTRPPNHRISNSDPARRVLPAEGVICRTCRQASLLALPSGNIQPVAPAIMCLSTLANCLTQNQRKAAAAAHGNQAIGCKQWKLTLAVVPADNLGGPDRYRAHHRQECATNQGGRPKDRQDLQQAAQHFCQ